MSKKRFDAEDVRVWEKDLHYHAYNGISTFDDEGVRVACAAD